LIICISQYISNPVQQPFDLYGLPRSRTPAGWDLSAAQFCGDAGTHRSGGRVEALRSPVHGTSLTKAGDNGGTARPITLSRFKRVIRGVTKPRPATFRPAIPAAGYEMTIEQVRDACDTGLMVEGRKTDWGVAKGERGMILNRLPGDRWEVLLDRGDIWTFETKEIYPVFDET
jgi:hypothetical protein